MTLDSTRAWSVSFAERYLGHEGDNVKKTVFSLLFTFSMLTVAGAQPNAALWQMWAEFDSTSSVVVDHTRWDRFLASYVIADDPSGVNLVDYRGVSPADKSILDRYIAALEATAVTRLNRFEQLAYWINLYNALTVRIILDHYPVNSIRDINLSRGLFTRGPWRAKVVEIEGEPVSLDDIEHRILRPIWQDPRVHYAVNCASMGCPNLQPTAFTATNTEELLDRGAREYTGHTRGVDLSNGRLVLSSVYDWFSEDFGGEDGALRHIASFVDPATARQLESYDGRVRYGYDWSLNER